MIPEYTREKEVIGEVAWRRLERYAAMQHCCGSILTCDGIIGNIQQPASPLGVHRYLGSSGFSHFFSSDRGDGPRCRSIKVIDDNKELSSAQKSEVRFWALRRSQKKKDLLFNLPR